MGRAIRQHGTAWTLTLDTARMGSSLGVPSRTTAWGGVDLDIGHSTGGVFGRSIMYDSMGQHGH